MVIFDSSTHTQPQHKYSAQDIKMISKQRLSPFCTNQFKARCSTEGMCMTREEKMTVLHQW